jgi:hypothetical protein
MDDDEILEGYLDGKNPESPEPSYNRSSSYRFGFANGRDDLNRSPRAPAFLLRAGAAAARREDENR